MNDSHCVNVISEVYPYKYNYLIQNQKLNYAQLQELELDAPSPVLAASAIAKAACRTRAPRLRPIRSKGARLYAS